jgi:hypothetical protein
MTKTTRNTPKKSSAMRRADIANGEATDESVDAPPEPAPSTGSRPAVERTG